MSTTLKPFGLKPAFHPSGLDRSTPFAGTNSYVTGTSGYSAGYTLADGAAFYQYQPVAIEASTGNLQIATTTAGSRMFGSFDGVEFTDSQGRRSVAKWISKAALAASTDVIFWIFSDPQLVYEIQATGPMAANTIGGGYNFSATAGYTPSSGTTVGVSGGAGFSTCALNPSGVAAGTQGQVKVVGLGREVAYPTGELNAWGDAYTIVQVQIANSQLVAPSVAI
jgi:hypothetical protein